MKPRKPLVTLAWSFGLFLLMHTTTYAGILMAALLSGYSFESIISGQVTNHLTILGQGVTAGTLGVLGVFLVTRYLWRRPWEWLRLRFDLRLLVSGFVLGIGMTIVTLLAINLFGDTRIIARPDRFEAVELASILIGSFGWVAFTAILEEVVFRGMAVREWALRWGWPIASVLGGVYFGAAHIIGLLPDISVIETLWIILAGIVGNLMFVALYVRSRSLWLPIGYHLGWNLCLKTIVGAVMSGRESSDGLFATEISGPVLMTGGKFGIEASVIALALSLVLSVMVLKGIRSPGTGMLSATPEKNHETTIVGEGT